jgi:type VI secretion system secreted protein VgrG
MPDAALLASLHIEGLAENALDVVECTGRDALSTPYEFTILCSAADASVNSRSLIRRSATLRLEVAGWKNAYSGLIFSFRKLRTVDGRTFYQASLAPRLKLLELTRHNQVFLNKSLPQIVEDILKECEILQYELRLMRIYEPLDYVCQYDETHCNFLSRWLEHWGLYYFFEETEAGEKLVITDTRISHAPVSDQAFPYRLASGLDEGEASRSIYDFEVEDTIVPKTVVLKDYNYLRPDLDLLVEAEVDPEGVGKTYQYGEHFLTTEQGQALAKIRAEELACGRTIQRGRGGCLPLRAGGLFSLSGHPDDACNTAYLVAGVTHEARRTSPLTSGLTSLTALEGDAGYRNAFETREASVQFRPKRLAEKTRITGMLTATIDAESSGQYAELDAMGRYKVRLPFDLAGKPDGHASSWLRLGEAYAGANYGAHFPLHKGTEVLLTFVGGDPDRPVIATALHNGENKNPIKDANARLSGIKTAGNNQLVFNDTEGQECVGLWSPFHNSGMAVGSVKKGGGGSLANWTSGDSDSFVHGSALELVGGSCTQGVLGATNYAYLGTLTNIVGPLAFNLNFGSSFTYNNTWGLTWDSSESTDFGTKKEQIGQESVLLSAGFPAPAAAAVTTANRALKYAIAAIAGLSAGSFALTETYSQNGIIADTGAWEGVLEGAGLTLGFASLAAAVLMARQSVKKILEANNKNRASTINLNNEGIEITANNLGGTPGSKKITISTTDTAKNSSLSIDINKIYISSKEKATLSFDTKSDNATIQYHVFDGGGMTIDNKGVYAYIGFPPNRSELNVEKGKISISTEADNQVFSSKNNGATSLKSPGSVTSITLTDRKIEIDTPAITIAHLIKINGNVIQLA